MRFRHALTVVALTAAASLPLTGAAYAQADRDCKDFASQAEAQEALDNAPGDPERLDENNDGVACESTFRETADDEDAETTEPAPTSAAKDDEEADDQDEPSQVKVLPSGGVDTGDGSTDPGLPAAAPALIALAGLGLLGAGTRQLCRAG